MNRRWMVTVCVSNAAVGFAVGRFSVHPPAGEESEARQRLGQIKQSGSRTLRNHLSQKAQNSQNVCVFCVFCGHRISYYALGFDEQAPLPAFAAPERDTSQPEQSPTLRLAAAARDEARAMVALARAESRPIISVGLRFEREEAEMGDEDTLEGTPVSCQEKQRGWEGPYRVPWFP